MDLFEQIPALFADFINPKKRIFFGYLLLAVVLAVVWLMVARGRSLRLAVAEVFDKRVFFSRSALADYQIFLLNRVFTLFISPALVSQLAIATAVFYTLHDVSWLRQEQFANFPTGMIVTIFTGLLFLVDDLTKYILHRWMHRWPLLWAIHKVHHSAETMTPITVYRVHPLEGVLYAIRGAVAQGVTMAVCLYLFGSAVDLYTVVGVNVLSFAFHVTGSNLRHSHVAIRYWPWLEHLLISPAQHQVHHSIAREHHDKNFGAAFAIWDWAFGSLHLSERNRSMTFGLPVKTASSSNIFDIYTRPFGDMARVMNGRAKRITGRLRRP